MTADVRDKDVPVNLGVKEREQQRHALAHMRIPLWQRQKPLDKPPAIRADQADPEQTVLPTNFEQLTNLPLSLATTQLHEGAILVVALRSEPLGESGDILLARMMLAIDIPQTSWVTCLMGEKSPTLADLLSQQSIGGIILLSPADQINQLNVQLTGVCDSTIFSTSQNNESTVLAGKLPQTRVSFCCLTDPQDLLKDGSLKRQAWDTLQAMQKSMTG